MLKEFYVKQGTGNMAMFIYYKLYLLITKFNRFLTTFLKENANEIEI